MDLISREDVINIATSSCLDLDSYDDTDEFCNEVKELPSAFEGMTNGEVVKALFPNVGTSFSNVFDLNLWWNAPYQKGGE